MALWGRLGLLPCGLLRGPCSCCHLGLGCLGPRCPRRRQLYQIFWNRGPRALRPLPLLQPPLPTALPHPGPQPAMRTGLDPAPARRARALGRAALPSPYLRPLLAPDTLSPAPITLALKEKHTKPGGCCTGL